MVVPAASWKKQKNGFAGARYCVWWFGLFVICMVAIILFQRFDFYTVDIDNKETAAKISTNTNNSRDQRRTPCQKAVDRLVDLEIRLVVLDFDLTISDIHTGGHWESSAHELASHVRPEMKCLIETSMQQGLLVAVGSFSAQDQVIREVIREAIPLAQNMTIAGGRNQSEKQGKREQLQIAIESYRNNGIDLTPSNTILIDDDEYNIRKASKDGYYSIWFDPKNVSDFFGIVSKLARK